MTSFTSLRFWQCIGFISGLAMGCGEENTSVTEALSKADQRAQAAQRAQDAKKAEAAKQVEAAKAGVVEHPWTFDSVKTNLKIGTTLVYSMEGTDKKGKTIADRLHGEIHGHDELDVKVLEYKDSQKNIPAVMQAQGHPWTKLGPFFWVEQNNTKILRKETVQVPAGSFDCVVADITGYFGNHLTVWMIADQPGIYAQVIEHPNTKNEDAKAEQPNDITYQLVSIERDR